MSSRIVRPILTRKPCNCGKKDLEAIAKASAEIAKESTRKEKGNG